MNKEPKSMMDEIFYKNLKLGTCPTCGSTIVSNVDNCLPFFYCLKCGEYLQVGDTKERE